MKALAKRMKENYEVACRHRLVRRMPAIIRVDGRAFHTYTKGMQKPFDPELNAAMLYAAQQTAFGMQGFKLGYLQSDEISFLLTDYDTEVTEAWFGYTQNKVESVTASTVTAHFNSCQEGDHLATFDARAFNVPREDVANYFLWRALDWERNSVSMLAQSIFSHKELHKKGRAAMHEMLHGRGINWATDLEDWEKNGTFFFKDGFVRHDIHPTYEHIAAYVDPCVNCEE